MHDLPPGPPARAPTRSSAWILAMAALGLAIAGAASGQPDRSPAAAGPPATGQTVSPLAPRVHGDEAAVGEVDRPDWSLTQREDRLGSDLDKSVTDGSLGQQEYARAAAALADIRATENRLRGQNHGQLTDTETYRLEGRIRTLAASIHWKR